MLRFWGKMSQKERYQISSVSVQVKTSGEIEVKRVHFHYPTRPEVQVLQGLDVDIGTGQTLALVGPSGCGKSTIVSLLERFYDPESGSLTLDGSDLRDLNIRWLIRLASSPRSPSSLTPPLPRTSATEPTSERSQMRRWWRLPRLPTSTPLSSPFLRSALSLSFSL